VINWVRIEELKDDIGAEDISDIVDLFLDEVEEVIERLRDGRQMASIEQDLHFLKGSALNLGFDRMGALCSKGEKQAAIGKADVPINQIIAVYDSSKIEFLAGLDLASP